MRGRGHFGGKRETTKEMRGRKKMRDDAEKLGRKQNFGGSRLYNVHLVTVLSFSATGAAFTNGRTRSRCICRLSAGSSYARSKGCVNILTQRRRGGRAMHMQSLASL